MKKLNLGSIIKIKENEKKIIVIGYNKKDENGDICRYEGIQYPNGIKEDKFYYFLDEEVIKIYDKGYDYTNTNNQID
ncbi:MAG: DUF4176 domain-containing protein [Mycoplasmatales bacterium]